VRQSAQLDSHKSMSDDQSDEKQAYEARLQRRVQILKKQFEAGKFHIAEGLQVIDSLKRVRYAPDGTVDLTTVDGLVRPIALAAETMYDREEMKKSASLAEIQGSTSTSWRRTSASSSRSWLNGA
jgi:hypothetical protein